MNRLLYGQPHPIDIGFITRVCPKCNGKKGRWYALNVITDEAVEVTETTYNLLPKTEEEAVKKRNKYCQMEFDKCDECNGEGNVYFSIEEMKEADREVY